MTALTAVATTKDDAHEDDAVLLTITDVAKRLRVGRTYAYELIAEGLIPVVALRKRPSHKSAPTRVRLADLRAYIDSLRPPAD